MRKWCGVEVAPAASLAGIGSESGIGSAGIEPELDDLAVGIQVFVELHLLPVEDSKVARLGVVLSPKREVRIANRLKQHARHAAALAVEDLEERVELRLRACGVDLDHPLLAGLGAEAIKVDVHLCGCPARDRPGDLSWKLWQRVRLGGSVVRLVLRDLAELAWFVRLSRSTLSPGPRRREPVLPSASRSSKASRPAARPELCRCRRMPAPRARRAGFPRAEARCSRSCAKP